MSKSRSPTGIRLKPYAYENFQGLDTSRDPVALDTQEEQHLIAVNNAFCDWRGNIVRDPGASRRDTNNKIIDHVRFYGKDLTAWAERDGISVTLNSENGVKQSEAYPQGSIVTSTVFNHKAVFFSRGQSFYHFDGFKWTVNGSNADLKPSFGVAIQRRLAVAGIVGRGTEIHFCRVDEEDFFSDDEDDGDTKVTRGAFLDIKNLIATSDEITGLGAFEQNRLVAFTSDQAIIYKIDPDLTKWEIDDRANIQVGCLSHNTIKKAGNDLIFCSRNGIHSVRRSTSNGLTVFTVPLSEKIELLWRSLVAKVDDPRKINACYDSDENQYHVFFPVTETASYRLTYTVSPSTKIASKWSTGDFLHARCGDFLGGVLVFGTPGGNYNIQKIEDVTSVTPTMEVETPTLWLGSIMDIADIHSITIQAAGAGNLIVEIIDDHSDKIMWSHNLVVSGPVTDDNFPNKPLSKQYERTVDRRAVGVRVRFRSDGAGLLRVIGFSLNVRQ